MEYEALNPSLYAQVLDDLELVNSHKPFQVLFYGSRERGDFNEDSDLNFYLLAHSTDQMKASFVDSIAKALSKLEVVAPVNMIAGDSDSLKHRFKIHEPGSIQLLENASVFFGEGIWEDLQTEWKRFRNQIISKKDLSHYLDKRIRFFKQQTSKSIKDEISQLERICTLTLHIWAIKNIDDLSLPELLMMDIPSQIYPLFTQLYSSEIDETVLELLLVQAQLQKLKKDARWKREINREEIHELKYKLISLRKDEEFLLNLWA
ncbi:hypothetical protein EHS15_07090 [Leptospira idonii]|uniref:Nucleotidyltransferase domain-containing protein n=1 Tax=Leptospira idonii TaxID=1193500 RepID=A0A4R9M1Q5_9LEPT|nr:hypothetical protein EHS15_07090 [Leptospira idonii]